MHMLLNRHCVVCFNVLSRLNGHPRVDRCCRDCGVLLVELAVGHFDTLPTIIARRNVGSRRLRAESVGRSAANRGSADGDAPKGRFDDPVRLTRDPKFDFGA
jgi:hypothetical protein